MYEWVQRQRPDAVAVGPPPARQGHVGRPAVREDDAGQPVAGRPVRGPHGRQALRAARRRGTTARPSSLRSRQPIDGRRGRDRLRPRGRPGRRSSAGRPSPTPAAPTRSGSTPPTPGMPILGDDEHHGVDAARLFLHAAGLGLHHPTAGALDLVAPRDRRQLRRRARRRRSRRRLDARRRWSPTRRGRCCSTPPTRTPTSGSTATTTASPPPVSSDSATSPSCSATTTRPLPTAWLDAWNGAAPLQRDLRAAPSPAAAAPTRRASSAGTATERFEVTELGARYLIDLTASATSSGLFLDQRETRRELMGMDLAGKTVLNAFAHTGSLSVAAARAGAETLTLDLSKRYLDWAADNLRAQRHRPGRPRRDLRRRRRVARPLRQEAAARSTSSSSTRPARAPPRKKGGTPLGGRQGPAHARRAGRAGDRAPRARSTSRPTSTA